MLVSHLKKLAAHLENSPSLTLLYTYNGHSKKISMHDLIRYNEVMENLVVLKKWPSHTSP